MNNTSRYSIIDAMEIEVAQADSFTDACHAAIQHAPASVLRRGESETVYRTYGWFNIKSAPRDKLILLCLGGRDYAIGHWSDKVHPPDWIEDSTEGPARFNLKPSHWMLLPDLPPEENQ